MSYHTTEQGCGDDGGAHHIIFPPEEDVYNLAGKGHYKAFFIFTLYQKIAPFHNFFNLNLSYFIVDNWTLGDDDWVMDEEDEERWMDDWMNWIELDEDWCLWMLFV